MDTAPRYAPSWPLPPYVFVPGENPHPKKKGGHMEGEADPKAPPINPERPQDNVFFAYGIDLYNYGYFWESHVYFEALWNAHGRKGSAADLLKGLIKLGAANLKLRLDQPLSAKGHFARARELFEEVHRSEGDKFLGLNLVGLIQFPEKTKLIPDW